MAVANILLVFLPWHLCISGLYLYLCCICICVEFVFVLYLCVCCICICIFSDTVTSGCCQHLACLSPLTSPSWQPMHIPTCYWWIIFAYLPTTIWVAIQPNTDFKGILLFCRWVNSFVGGILRLRKKSIPQGDVQMHKWLNKMEEHWMSNKSINDQSQSCECQ